MLLVIDIGNTDITLGVFEGEELRATWHMAPDIHRRADEYAALLFNLLHSQRLDTSNIKAAALCSCLLYTSPSPRDRTRSRMPSSA